MKRKQIVKLVIVFLLSGVLFLGCSGTEEPEVVEPEVVEEVPQEEPEPLVVEEDEEEEEVEIEEEEEEEEEGEEYRTVGVKTDDAYEILLTNLTGEDIVEFAIRTTLEEEFPRSMLSAESVFYYEETIRVFYTPEEIAQDEMLEDEPEVDYVVWILLADEREFELNGFTFNDMAESVAIFIADEVAFIEFESIILGELFSTLELELALRELHEAAGEVAVYVPEVTYIPAYTPTYTPTYTPAPPQETAVYVPAQPPPPPPPPQETEICLPDDVIINEWDD